MIDILIDLLTPTLISMGASAADVANKSWESGNVFCYTGKAKG